MRIFSAKCTSSARLDGKTAIITGCNTGIGKCTAQDLFMRGGRVIMACRNLEKATEALNEIKESCKNTKNLGEIIVTELDLASFKSIRKCASQLLNTEKKIDLLVNNAGVMTMMCSESRTEDGFEIQFGTNYLGHFLLTLLLLPKICQSTSARIVNVSSMGHTGCRMDFDDLSWKTRKYSSFQAYKQSKLANILFSKELARKLKENNITGVNVYSLHPGVINSDIGRHIRDSTPWGLHWVLNVIAWFIKTPEQGAQTTIYCAVDEKCASETGLYYAECGVKEPSKEAKDEEDAKKLWDVSLKLVGLDKDNFFNNNIN